MLFKLIQGKIKRGLESTSAKYASEIRPRLFLDPACQPRKSHVGRYLPITYKDENTRVDGLSVKRGHPFSRKLKITQDELPLRLGVIGA